MKIITILIFADQYDEAKILKSHTTFVFHRYINQQGRLEVWVADDALPGGFCFVDTGGELFPVESLNFVAPSGKILTGYVLRQ